MTIPEPEAAPAVDCAEQFTALQQRLQRMSHLLTTRAAIAQTPKEVVWTLNKAKLYRYVPVMPAAQRHPVPLLLVFALMNRPLCEASRLASAMSSSVTSI